MEKRVLIVSEAFSMRASGGRAAIAIAAGLRELGADVQIATFWPRENCEDELQKEFRVTFLGRGSEWRQRLRQFVPLECMGPYRALLNEFRPKVVHFASFEYGKSRFLISTAKSVGASVVLQPWTYSAICAQGYGYRDGGPCDACFNGNFENAARLGCLSGLRSRLYGINRKALRATALEEADWYLSTSVDMDERLAAYGVIRARILRLSLPFYPTDSKRISTTDGAAFAFNGQFTDFKGVHLLPQLLRKCSEVNFVLFPFGSEIAAPARFGITPERFRNLRIATNLSWSNGLAGELAKTRGLLLTTLWPSTTEYSLIEALAMSKPVIAFAVGAYRDFLADGVNAMIAPVGDVDGFAERLRRLNAEPALRARIGQAGRTLYEQLWEPTAWRHHLAAAYGAMGYRFD